MLTLNITNAPQWCDLIPGVRVKLRPLTTALMVSARGDPAIADLPEGAASEEAAIPAPTATRTRDGRSSRVDYEIDARLEEVGEGDGGLMRWKLHGKELLTWTNESGESVPDLWLYTSRLHRLLSKLIMHAVYHAFSFQKSIFIYF